MTQPSAPLNDPSYEPKHPPINGNIPAVVERWGAASQVRWFWRFRRGVGMRRDEFWDAYFPTSVEHKGLCCYRCSGEEDPADWWDGPECCHKAPRKDWSR